MVPDTNDFDVFVSHASEDKARFVEPLIAALQERGLRVWYDSNEIRVGDDFRLRMDDGLSRSRFGVVVLSPRFFKYWPQAELSALFQQESAFDQTRILPIRLDLDHATLTVRSPLLAARAALGWELGVCAIAERIHGRVREVPSLVRPSPTRVYNLPARRARELFGRESDLRRLEELLGPGRNVRLAASIEGLAGVGKTELAIHLVDRLSEAGRFPGGIFWLDAENPDLTLAWGTTIADELAVGAGTLEERASAAVRIASSGSPVLVVLDNVEQWTRASEPRPLPHGAQVALLVTTRHRFLAGPSFAHHALETLPENAARELLVSVAGRDLDAGDLLRFLDGHTLAIELAGAYLREFPGVTAAAYLARLAEGLPVEEKVQDLVRYESTVRRALDVHWGRLDDAAREALLVAACFAPEDASIALLEACGVEAEALQPLRRFHLIAGDGERWRMHRLVREWARRSASEEDLARARRAFVEGCAAFSRTITLEEGYRVYRNDGPHLDEAVRDAEAVLGSGDARVSDLWDGVARALQAKGELPRAKELLEQALTWDLKNLGEEHPSVAASRSNLALVLQDLGELPRAKELLEKAVVSAEKNLGEEHPSVAMRRSNLAMVLKHLGELPRAKELLERALASNLKNLGEEHPSVAIRRFNLASFARDQGDLARARELFTQTLAAQERAFGDNHPSTAHTRVSLAEVLDRQGELEPARAEAARALEAVRSQPEGSSFRVQVERIAGRILRSS
ncbi:MAG: tetratricopeptide repeat protein [Thermoanaerobaculia bacterium]